MIDLTIRIGDHEELVRLEPNQVYRIKSVSNGQEFTTTVSSGSPPTPTETGICVAHREPLYDGSDMCPSCWDEFDAYLESEDDS